MIARRRIATILESIDRLDKDLLQCPPGWECVPLVDELRLIVQRAKLVLKLAVPLAMDLPTIPSRKPRPFAMPERKPRVLRTGITRSYQ